MSKICEKCKKENRNKVNFCSNCGFAFISVKEQAKYRTYIKDYSDKLGAEDIKAIIKRKDDLKSKLRKIAKSDQAFFLDWGKRIIFMIEALEDSINGSYLEFSEENLQSLSFAVSYLLNPFGMIPDIIPYAGYTDDEAIISTVWFMNKDVLEDYSVYKGKNLDYLYE